MKRDECFGSVNFNRTTKLHKDDKKRKRTMQQDAVQYNITFSLSLLCLSLPVFLTLALLFLAFFPLLSDILKNHTNNSGYENSLYVLKLV
jgi:hypothetical protein